MTDKENAMTDTRIHILDLFGDRALDLWALDINGAPHISNRYVAIRADLIDLDDHQAVTIDPKADGIWDGALTSDNLDTIPLHPEIAGSVVACGFILTSTDASDRAGFPIIAIRRGAERVGYLQSAREGVGIHDLHRIVTVAQNMSTSDKPRDWEFKTVGDVLYAAGVVKRIEVTQ